MITPMQLTGLVVVLAFVFGVALKTSDLLQDDGFEWFRGGKVVAGLVCGLLIVALLSVGGVSMRLFWLTVVLHWILRARIDGVNHGIFATAMLLHLLVVAPVPLQERPSEFGYLFATLALLGLLHDLYQYTAAPAPAAVRWFFANQHLSWYLIGLGHSVLFGWDVPLLAMIYAFVKGYGLFYVEGRRRWLKRVGIRPPGSSDESGTRVGG